MLMRRSSSRNHSGKRLWPRHSFQAFLLVAVGVWLVYQLSHSYGKRRAVVVEADDGDGMDDGEPVRRRLGRKGFVDFAGVAFDDDVVGDRARSHDVGRGAASSDDPLSEDGDGEGGDGEEEDQEADEDDDGVDDADDGLAADEEEGDRDFQSQDGNSEDELNAEHSETDGANELGDGAGFLQPSEVNSSAVPQANPTGRVQDGAATVLPMAPKNTSFQGNDRERTGDAAKKLLVWGT